MKDAYSCDRDEAGLDVSYEAQHERLRPDLRAARPRDGRGQQRRRDHGRHPGPRVHGPQSCRRGRPRPVRGVRLRGQPPGRPASRSPDPAAEEPCRSRRSRRPGTTTIATLAAFLGIGAEPDGEGGVLRRPATAASSPRSSAATTRSTRRSSRTPSARSTGIRPATVEEIKAAGMEPGYGSPIGARRHGRGRRRARRPLAEPRGGREPRGLPLPERQRRARLHGRRRRRDHERPGRRSLPDLRLARDPAQRDRGRQHLQARHEVHRCRRGNVPRRGRQGAPDHHGLVRDRRRAERRLHRRGPSRRQGDHLAGGGRAVRRPPRGDRCRPGPGRRGACRPAPPALARGRARDPLRRPRRVAGRQVHRCGAARDALDPDGRHRVRSRPAGSRSRSARPASVRPARSPRSRR